MLAAKISLSSLPFLFFFFFPIVAGLGQVFPRVESTVPKLLCYRTSALRILSFTGRIFISRR